MITSAVCWMIVQLTKIAIANGRTVTGEIGALVALAIAADIFIGIIILIGLVIVR